MAPPLSLLPELDEIVKHGSAEKRSMAIERIAELFLQGSAHFGAQHVSLFDDILIGLVPTAELATRAGLASRLATLANAPPSVINYLAHEDEIRVAGPVLSKSLLVGEAALLGI